MMRGRRARLREQGRIEWARLHDLSPVERALMPVGPGAAVWAVAESSRRSVATRETLVEAQRRAEGAA